MVVIGHLQGCINTSAASRLRYDFSPPLVIYEDTSGIPSPVFVPQYKIRVDKLEQVHWRANKMVRSPEDMMYEEGLKGPGLFSLEEAEGAA